ncbi:hypothetical protein LUZ61_003271 [Rhynchospora tenuis]|uniref:Integrase catalytic domain-containing protein n=1 Tax=Rhynchospora tenuis TaxID=198213 RepID=A0AAD6ESL5_9POAL|nr:hypothetical protein LUZ61_003271 [Rhynchospora tenuis]
MLENSSTLNSSSSNNSDHPVQFTHQISTSLTSDNYLLWQFQVLPVLIGHGLMAFLDASRLPRQEYQVNADGVRSVNPDYDKWLRQDQLILAWILNSLSPQILAQVVNCNTTAQLWQYLQQLYNSQSLAKVLEYKLQLQTIRKGADTCAQYLQKIQNIADRLRSIGAAVSDQDLILHTLQGLGTEFESFVTAASMRQDQMSMAELHSHLLAQESRQRANLQASAMAHSVQLANQKGSNNMGRASGPIQYSDTKPNGSDSLVSHQELATHYPIQHNVTNNQGRGSNSNRRGSYRGRGRGRQSTTPKEDVYCQICTKWGHPAYKCHHRFDLAFNGPTPLPNSSSSSQSQQPQQTTQPHQALVAEPSMTSPTASWFMDSGATTHVTPDLNNLSSSQVYTGTDQVHMGNGKGLTISHTGVAYITTSDTQLVLNNVLCVPQLTKNLLSISQLLKDNNITVEFTPNCYFVKDQATQKVILRGSLCNGLYALDINPFTFQHQIHHTVLSSADMWHSRLAHCSLPVIKALQKHHKIHVSRLDFSDCGSCNKAKAHKLPFSSSVFDAQHPLHVIHTDVWGPAPVISQFGHRYYVVFTDQFSRFSWIYFCASKSDVLQLFIKFKAKAELLTGHKIKIVQCDGGTEYKPLQTHFPEITFHISCPYTPEQNGIAERKHRHIVELGLASMNAASIPLEYWDTIFESTLFVINRLPATPNDMQSPFEKLFKQVPDYQFLHTLGCECYPLLRPYNQHKLQPRSEVCVFMGYSALHKGYKCLHIPTQRFYISRHVKFIENKFSFANLASLTTPDSSPVVPATLTVIPHSTFPSVTTTETHHSSPVIDSSSPESVPPESVPTQTEPNETPIHHTPPPPISHHMTTRSKANKTKPKKFPGHQLYSITKYPVDISQQHTEPTCYTQAVKYPEWRQAMASELDALAKNNTWVLVDPPLQANIIGCKWLYKLKRRADGTVERYKAGLVAKGYTQEEGLDYFETFSPVVKPATIRTVLTIALANNWHVHQLDVNNAFLHGDLEETIYMQQPPGFVDSLNPDKVCLLKKALYGLKQAPRAWFHKLRDFLQSQKFQCSQSDNSLFVFQEKGTVLYILVYVDDIIITGNNMAAITGLMSTLQSAFSIKDLGQLNYFLGIQVIHSPQSMHLNQTQYIHSILEKTNMAGAKPCKSPMEAGLQLSKYSGVTLSDPHMYIMTVGALQYATIIRPDITFAVNKVSQFMSAPTDLHWQAVKRVLRYLKGTIHHGLHLQASPNLCINAYTDADWAGCPDERKSTTGYAVYLGCNLISWSSKKQHTVARSSTEAEYRSMAMATAELLWIQSLLGELGVRLNIAPVLWCDNLGATFLAANPVFHARTKHIELDFHFIREQVATKRLNIQFLCSADQIADVLTKPLPSPRFKLLSDKLTHILPHILLLLSCSLLSLSAEGIVSEIVPKLKEKRDERSAPLRLSLRVSAGALHHQNSEASGNRSHRSFPLLDDLRFGQMRGHCSQLCFISSDFRLPFPDE